MREIWGKLIGLGILVLAMIGCRTPQPDLKPPDSPENLTVPPSEARYNSPAYPKQAMIDRDPLKKPGGEIVPAQGFGGPPPPSMGGPGYR